MIGGEKKVYNKVSKYLKVIGNKLTYIGKSGSGQVAKACNQILVANTMVAVSEILLISSKTKTDPKLVQKALLGGLVNSKILEIHGKRMIDNTNLASKPLHLKDLKIAMQLMRNLDLDLKSAKYSKELMQKAINNNYHNYDSSIVNKIVKSRKSSLNLIYISYNAHMDNISSLLVEKGITPTKQRLQLASLIFNKISTSTASNLLTKVQDVGYDISQATVYNTLWLFEKECMLKTIDMHNECKFYDTN